MGRVELLEPLFEAGVRNTNFFNGRLLSAQDLRTEQDAVRARLARAARAVGEGIVEGLWVEKVKASASASDAARAVVSVSRGLAVCRAGTALSLPFDTEVALVAEPDADVEEGEGRFKVCVPPTTSSVPAGAGVYVLAVAPANGFEGKAPASGLSEPSGRCGCGSRYEVEGVRFKLVGLNVATNKMIDDETRARIAGYITKADGGDAAGLSLLRNELAHACFGAAAFEDFTRDPFARAAGGPVFADDEGALGELRASGALDVCDVPLALVYWSRGGVEFVDPWAVRRRATHASQPDRWSEAADDSRQSACEAALRQFQHHLESLRAPEAAPQRVVARDYFRYLPPVGYVPVAPPNLPVAGLFEYPKFFERVTRREPVHMEGARFGALLRHAAPFAAHDLASGQMLRLYWVRQNTRAIAEGSSARYYLVFASGHVPFAGEARFDISLWDYSNYV
jgi:hypothetical protein